MRLNRRRLGTGVLALAMLPTLLVPSHDASAATSPQSVTDAASHAYAPADQSATAPISSLFAANCPDAPPGFARCFSAVKVDAGGSPALAPTPRGYGPAQYRGAYNLNGTSSPNNAVVAVVDAYDNPNVKADLDTYSTTYGIPVLPTCTVAIASSTVPCFQKVDQNGGTTYPPYNAGWAGEIALDVQAAHAICQNCRILLVEAVDNQYTNLMAGVDRARQMGAHVISNSYGGNETSGLPNLDSHFNYSGIAFTVSSGDDGFEAGPQWPAASNLVTAVGGTALSVGAGNTYGGETVWNWHTAHGAAGSGCSALESKPAFQTDTGCPRRMIADVSADASNAAVYITPPGGTGSWSVFGGTSLAAPMIGAMYGLAGGVPPGQFGNAWLYAHMTTSNLHDVTDGNNLLTLPSCGVAYYCNGVAGYDGPTGRGSPNGLGAFVPPTPAKITMTGPTGTVSTTRPTYTWKALTPAPIEYYLADYHVDNNAWEINQLLHNPDPTCNALTCSWTIPANLPALGAGTHLAYMNARNEAGWGTSWSDPVQFCVITCTPTKPGKVHVTGPTGVQSTNQPAFTWDQLSGAVDQYWVYDYSWNTAAWDLQQPIDNPHGTICNGTTCSWIPPAPLTAGGRHTFYAIAKNSVGWSDWSDPLDFYIPGNGFNSQFDNEMHGWTMADPNTWTLSTSGFLATTGVPGAMASVGFQASYSTLDYSVRMARYSSNYASGVIVRGTMQPLGTNRTWRNGYALQYWRDRSWAVYKYVNGTETALASGGGSAAIDGGDAYNTIRVTASGSTLSFYANGQLIHTRTETQLTSGWVGIYDWNPNPTDGWLVVDWATLTTSVGGAAATSPSAAAAGTQRTPPAASSPIGSAPSTSAAPNASPAATPSPSPSPAASPAALPADSPARGTASPTAVNRSR